MVYLFWDLGEEKNLGTCEVLYWEGTELEGKLYNSVVMTTYLSVYYLRNYRLFIHKRVCILSLEHTKFLPYSMIFCNRVISSQYISAGPLVSNWVNVKISWQLDSNI